MFWPWLYEGVMAHLGNLGNIAALADTALKMSLKSSFYHT